MANRPKKICFHEWIFAGFGAKKENLRRCKHCGIYHRKNEAGVWLVVKN